MVRRLCLGLVLVVLLAPWLAVAASPADVTSLVLDPFAPNTLYAGTPERGVFKSADGGATWNPTGLANTPVFALGIDPGFLPALYAVTPLGVLKSSDGGDNWAATGLMNELISYPTWGLIEKPLVGTYRSLAIAARTDPQMPATLYAGVNYATADAFYDFVWDEVNISTDGAYSAGPLLPYGADPWAYPPWRTTQVLAAAAVTPTVPASVYTSGFYEYDVCFVRVETSEIGCAVLGHAFAGGATALVVDPQTPNIVYAGTNGSGVYKSTNGGVSWSGGGTGTVTSLAVDRHTLGIVYAGTDDLGVLKSTDGGTTWSAANTGLTSYLDALGLRPAIRVVAVDPLVTTTVYAGTAAGVFKSTDGGGTWNLTGLTQQSPLIGLKVVPSAVTRGEESTGTVTLSSAAPTGGTAVMLSSTETAVANVPANVTVAAGATSASFAISTSQGLSSPVTVKISATLDDAARSAALTVVPPLSHLFFWTNRVAAGTALTGTVGLALPAAAGGAVVSLSTSDPAVATVPATVTISPGATSGNFTVTTNTVTAATTVTITASYGGDTKSMILDVVPTWLVSFTLGSRVVPAGTGTSGTVFLFVPAPPGGAVVTLSSSMPSAATLPASVIVAAGATSASFAISTNPVLPPGVGEVFVRITAANGGGVNGLELRVIQPAFTLSSLSLDAASAAAGTSATGTVILSAAATAGGATIALSSSNPAVVSVPASVTVPAGSTSATFPVSTGAATAPTTVTITALYAGQVKGTVVNVVLATLSSLSLNPASVAAGSMSTGTVTLGVPAPPGGVLVTLSSSNTAVAAVLPSVTVAAGATSANFSVSTTACTAGSATLSGAYGGASRSAGLTVTSNPDNVTVQLADYYAGRDELRVSARSTNSTATLQVHLTSSGALIGTMRNLGDGKFSGQFTRSVNPQSITVRSSLCGSAMTAVRKR